MFIDAQVKNLGGRGLGCFFQNYWQGAHDVKKIKWEIFGFIAF